MTENENTAAPAPEVELEAYRQTIHNRLKVAEETQNPNQALRLAISTTPFSGDLRRLDPSDYISPDIFHMELARWLIAVGDRMEDHFSRFREIESRYSKLVAEREAVRRFFGTGIPIHHVSSQPLFPQG